MGGSGGGSFALHCTTISTSILQFCAPCSVQVFVGPRGRSLSQDDTILNAMDLDSGLSILFCFAVSQNITFTLRSHCVLALHDVWHKHLSGGWSFCAESTHCTLGCTLGCALGCALYCTVMHSSALYHISVNCEV